MKWQNYSGWILFAVLFFAWTAYHKREDEAARRQKQEQARADSLARAHQVPAGPVQAGPIPTAGDSAARSHGDTSSLGAHRIITIEDDHLVAELDNQGAKLRSLRLKDLEGAPTYNPILIPAEKGGALGLALGDRDMDQVILSVSDTAAYHRLGREPFKLEFRAASPKGGELRRAYTFIPDSMRIRHELRAAGYGGAYALAWNGGLGETEKLRAGKGFGLRSTYFSELVMDNGSNVERENFTGEKAFNAESGVLRWVGLRRKYVAAVLNFHRDVNHKVEAVGYRKDEEEKDAPPDYRLALKGSNYEDGALDFEFAVLPLDYDRLLKQGQNYEKIIFSGWEWFFMANAWYPSLCGLVLHLLQWFHRLIPNYGVAIILLTLLVRFITLPLTIAQTRSAAKMQEHAPAIKRIRDKHKNSPTKVNQEIMEYYRKHGVSPFSGVMGCFPALLQMPIFIALFNVLGRAVELRQARFFGWINDLSYPDVVAASVKVPYLFPVGITILPLIWAVSMWLQMKMTIKDPNQRFMVWMMPVTMFIFSSSFPSGLVLYWLVSNIFTIAQTWALSRRKPAPVPAMA